MKKRRKLCPAPRLLRPLVERLEDRRLLAAVITVNSAADTNTRDTAITLREAILINNRTLTIASLSAAEQSLVSGASSNADADTIQFNIDGLGVQTISPTSALPNITDPVTINGYSQPGAAANTNDASLGLNTALRIELAGNNAGGGVIGLRLAAGSGGSTIRGLAINRFAAQGIQIDTSGNTIAGNFIGTNAAGTAALPNADNGVIIFSGSNNVIGGTSSADRNLLSGNDDNGVALVFAAASGNIIQGNLIGTDLTGTQDVGNAFIGIYSFQAVNTVIGGTAPGAGNVISGNNIDGIQFQGGSNNATIQGNRIGMNVAATAPLPNLRDGIRLEASGGTKIGGDGGGNIIAHNGSDGVSFVGGGLGNTVLSNSIYANGALGIDLGDDGVDFPQDAKGFLALHRGQNFPTITSVTPVASGTEIRGFFKNEYGPKEVLVQLFASAQADASGFGEGQTYLGEVTFSVPANTVGGFAALVAPLPSGQAVVTATATVAGDGTSEFSSPFNPTVYTVTNTANSGPGSLREAITAANAHVGADRIQFNIPASDAGHVYYANDNVAGQITLANVTATTATSDAAISNIDPDWPHSWFSIAPTAALPAISDSVTIDGYSQGQGTAATDDDATANTNTVVSGLGLNTVLRVELTGKNAGSLPFGMLEGSAGGIAIQGLAINRFQGYGVLLGFQTGGNLIAGNFLGPDISGTRAFSTAQALDSVVINSLAEDVIGGTTAAARNLISGNTGSSFRVSGVFSNANDRIEGNLIGTDRSGTKALGNKRGVYGGSTLIGGSDPNAPNVISGNTERGIEPGSGAVIQNNLIGTDVSGKLPLGNPVGIEIQSGSSQTTKDNISILENKVAFNGIGIRLAGAQGNLITRNSIFSNAVLGIQYNFTGYTANDVPPASSPPDQDTGPNALQNHPVLTLVTDLAPGTRIQGSLTSAPNSNFRLEFFGNNQRDEASVNGAVFGSLGQGQTYLGSSDVTTDATGLVAFSVDLPVDVSSLPGAGGQPFITATATNITLDGGSPLNNTSQFSPVEPLGGSKFVVTTTADGGLGTLREAILVSNFLADSQIITFAIPATDPRHFYYQDDGVAGTVSLARIAATTAATDAAIPTTGLAAIDPDWPHSWFSIRPSRALPTVIDTAIVDGYSQAAASPNTLPPPQGLNTVLKLELSGELTTGASGLHLGLGLSSVAHQVRGLAINRWRTGIDIDSTGANQISGNFIGSDVSGTLALPNSNGIFVEDVLLKVGGSTPAERNLISGNTLTAIHLFTQGGTTVEGNLIGADRSGTAVLGSATNGIAVNGAVGVKVGKNVFALQDSTGGQGVTFTIPFGLQASGGVGVALRDPNDPFLRCDESTIELVLSAMEDTVAEGKRNQARLAELSSNNNDYYGDEARIIREEFLPGNAIFYRNCQKRLKELRTQNPNIPLGDYQNDNTSFTELINAQGGQSLGVALAATDRLAIDLGGDGVTPNDLRDADTGPNDLQNYPVLVSALNVATGGRVIGSLNSLPSSQFRIDFFTSARLHFSGHGPGEVFLDSLVVTTDASGNAAFTLQVPAGLPAGRFVTSLATHLLDGDGLSTTPLLAVATSEFSAGVPARNNPWHNQAKALDVKPDGKTVAGDALEIINYINAFGSGVVPANAQLGIPAYYDTTNDAFVAPNDVLEIVNYINAFGADGEGESAEGEAAPPTLAGDDWLALLAMDLAGQPSSRKKGA